MPSHVSRFAMERRRGRPNRLWAAFVVAAVVLGACETAGPPPLGTVGYIQGFVGDVVADEPRAVQVGQEVLSAGGTAADAAVALYFTLAVTLPSRASLGGGGACVVYDAPTQETEALEFLPRPPAGAAAGIAVPVAIPGNPRGMFALHSRYGRLLWEQLIAPAENLAQTGYTVSAALAEDLRLGARYLAKDEEGSRIFTREDGGIMREGDTLYQPDLAALLAELRTRGVGEFYEGSLAEALARRFTEAAAGNGEVAEDDLREYQPAWRKTLTVAYDEKADLHFAPAPTAAGTVAAQMWRMLDTGDRYAATPEEGRAHLFAEVSMRAFADRGRWLGADGENAVADDEIVGDDRVQKLMSSFDPNQHTKAKDLTPAPVAFPENPAAAGFVVVDREGSAVACSLTMNNLFGLGRVARGTGIMLATAPAKGSGATALLPMVMLDRDSGEILFAAAAGGGTAAPTALMTVMLRALAEDDSLEDAIAAKRLHHSGLPDMVLHEKGISDENILALAVRGHRVYEMESLGLVDAVYCPGGVRSDPGSCAAQADPRGFGSAFSSED